MLDDFGYAACCGAYDGDAAVEGIQQAASETFCFTGEEEEVEFRQDVGDVVAEAGQVEASGLPALGDELFDFSAAAVVPPDEQEVGGQVFAQQQLGCFDESGVVLVRRQGCHFADEEMVFGYAQALTQAALFLLFRRERIALSAFVCGKSSGVHAVVYHADFLRVFDLGCDDFAYGFRYADDFFQARVVVFFAGKPVASYGEVHSAADDQRCLQEL